MPAQTSKAQQPDNGTALILGGVLGLLFASVAAVAVGGWQYRQSQLSASPAVIVPANGAAPVAYPANNPYPNSNPYTVPAGAATNPQPATYRRARQSTDPNAKSNPSPVVPAPANRVAPSLKPPDASNSVELPSEDSPPDSVGE